jgi:hypothetical protein
MNRGRYEWAGESIGPPPLLAMTDDLGNGGDLCAVV